MKRILVSALALTATTGLAHAQDGTVKIGVLNDQSSSFSALGGTEVVRAVELAIADHGGQALGKPIELVSADHQNKPEVGLGIARQWLEQDDVDVIADMANSAIALGVNTLIGEKGRIGLFVSPLTDKFTEADCNGNVIAWAYDAYSTFTSPVKALLAEGVDSFFILSPDYEAGKVQEATEIAAIEAGGGKVMGAVRAPLNSTDFSAFLLQAQASGAKALILNANGPDLVNAVKQVQEFGLISQGMVVGLGILHQSDARAIGVEALQGARFASPWFWKKDAESEAFGRRMMEVTGNAPGWVAAGAYSAVSNYLKAVEAAGTDDPKKVLEQMRSMKIEDFFVKNATLYPNGRLVHDMYALQVKAPAEVGEKDDFFTLVSTVPAADAFLPYEKSACTIGK
ncbi:ABC transporter substrate-binding protein [Pontitalea aquivivens]|uniref:ABC transporter substrate-binding protein n=1 Tax=Pontitalea aquivivens TaxID=3388663 RepID=UPI0039707B59